MPGAVAAASPATVMPSSLCTAWNELRAHVVRDNTYVDGSGQRAVLTATTSRRSWALSKRLTVPQWESLRQFFLARRGGTEPFYWYYTKASYDATGVSTTNRITVRFDGALSRNYGVARQDVSLRLIEIS